MLSASEEDLSPYRDLMRLWGTRARSRGWRRKRHAPPAARYGRRVLPRAHRRRAARNGGDRPARAGCASFATASFPVLPVVRETGGRDRLSSLYCPISPNAAVIYAPAPSGMGGCELLGARDVVRLNAAYFEADFVRFVVAKDRRTLEEARSFAEAKRPSPPLADPFDDRDGHGVSEGFVTTAVRSRLAAELHVRPVVREPCSLSHSNGVSRLTAGPAGRGSPA